MMHSHDRTMLAKFGFADPDRKEPLHDVACQYLVSKEVAGRLSSFLKQNEQEYPAGKEQFTVRGGNVLSAGHEKRYTKEFVGPLLSQAARECEISKGYGQYRTTVGFCDIVLYFRIELHYRNVCVRDELETRSGFGRLEKFGEWRKAADECINLDAGKIGIEVKVTAVSMSDVIRQVKLYRSYSGIDSWLIATTYEIGPGDLEFIKNEGIGYVRLANKFQAFVANQSKATPVVVTEV